MKQHITPSQAQEITEEQFYSLFDEIVKRKDWAHFHHKKVTIGKCIEVLENSNRFKGLHKSDTDGEYKVYVVLDDSNGWNEYIKSDKELVNALWQAVKEIL